MTTILTKKKDTTGAPAPGDLTNSAGGAELAVNTFDKRLYTKDSGGNVVEIGTNPSTIDTTTVDTTNLEVTNIKAKDGTAAATIANSTGKITVSTELAVDNLNLSGNTISSTDTNGAINLAPNGTGQVVFNAGAVGTPALTTTGDTNTGIFFPAADTIAFTEGGAEAMRIDSSGRVGIGTTSPSYRLHVVATDATAGYFNGSGAVTTIDLDNTNANGWGSNIAIRTGGTAAGYFGTIGSLLGSTAQDLTMYATSGNGVRFYTNGNNERMRIDSSGNVGIGTSSPVGRLAVNGISNLGTGFASTDITNTRPLYVRSSDNNSLASFQNSSTTGDGFMVGLAGAEARLQVVNNLPLAFLTNNTERMRITSGGNVGIGTSSPSSAFHLARSTAVNVLMQVGNSLANTYYGVLSDGSAYCWNGNNYPLLFGTNNTERMRIDSSGNVGIGISSPTNYGAGTTTLSISNATNSGYLDIYNAGLRRGYHFATSSTYNISTTTSTALVLETVGTERMRIDSSGNVQIGTTTTATAAAALTLYKAGGVELYLQNSTTGTGSNGSRILANGNDLYITNKESGVMIFETSDTERMRIGSDGRIYMGSTAGFTNGGRVHIQTTDQITADFYRVNTSASNQTITRWVCSDGGGTVVASITTSGALSIAGALSKGSGSFRIDHPLPEKSETHQLVHSFVEAPQADNIYRGKTTLVNGRAEVNIDQVADMTEGTFVALNREVQCFTSNETDWDAVRGSVNGNILTIECQNNSSTATISWLVIGERQDKHMYDTDWTDENGKVIVEPLKSK